MRTRRAGGSGPELTVVGFGAWEAGGDAWGPNTSEDAPVAAMRAGFDAGITWIDTAEVYGGGVSERLVGRAIAGRRDELVVATKVAPSDEGTGFRPEQIRSACDASLERLGIDVIDLYQLHWPDPSGIPVEESWGTMAELRDAGKIRFLGVSNFDRGLIERCEAIRHVDSLQQEFSMLALDDRELIRWCGEQGTGVVCYGPLGFGALTGMLSREQAAATTDWRRSDEGPFREDKLDRNFAIVDGLRPIAAGLGIPMAQVAIAWNLAQPGVTAAIAGSRNPDHTRDNAAAGDLTLDDVTLDAIEALLVAG